MLYVVKRTVKVESDFRNNAKLLADLVSELATKSLCILLKNAHDSLCLL